jgi:Ni,Fe-hydrogenase maturation factor
MRVYLANAFSLNMLSEPYHLLECRQLEPHIAALLLHIHGKQLVNAIGHEDLDAVVNNLLTLHVPHLVLPKPERLTVKLAPADAVIVAQYTGPRLEPGTTTLPEDARITFWLVHQCRSPRSTTIAELIDAYQTAIEREARATEGQLPSYAHWEGIIELTRRAEELGARPVETLEALQQLSTYAGF